MSIPLDPKYAVQLWKKSRDKGSPFAAYSLAMMKLGDNPSSYLVEDDTVDPLDTVLQLAENGFTQALVRPSSFLLLFLPSFFHPPSLLPTFLSPYVVLILF
jgi:hypothetical protein